MPNFSHDHYSDAGIHGQIPILRISPAITPPPQSVEDLSVDAEKGVQNENTLTAVVVNKANGKINAVNEDSDKSPITHDRHDRIVAIETEAGERTRRGSANSRIGKKMPS